MTESELIDELNDKIKDVIVQVNAIDTGNMFNSTFFSIAYTSETDFKIVLNTVEYFKYVDEGTQYITARNILKQTLEDSNVRNAIKRYKRTLLIDYIK